MLTLFLFGEKNPKKIIAFFYFEKQAKHAQKLGTS
jgi:hypothetical protein